jgi:hypothetical protein
VLPGLLLLALARAWVGRLPGHFGTCGSSVVVV